MIEIRCDKIVEVKGVKKKCNRLLLEVSSEKVGVITKCPKCKQMFYKEEGKNN